METVMEMLEAIMLISAVQLIFLIPAAILALIGKIFGIKELTDAFKF